MKVIVVGGYPGSGKSTIVREVIKELEQQGHHFHRERQGIMRWMESGNLIILGDYNLIDTEIDKFPGTDRLPLNVQPEAQRFLLSNREQNKVVLFEGDRLFNDSMLSFLNENGFERILCIVFTAQYLLESRREKRSDQNASWRKGRETKVNRIGMTYPVHHHLQNNTQEEQRQSVNELLQEIDGTWKQEQVKSKIKDLWR